MPVNSGRIRPRLWLAATVLCVMGASGVVHSQVHRCFAEVCTTGSDGKTICVEKEVPCPSQEETPRVT